MSKRNKEFSIIIQARINSSRLKGKILKKINNQEILSIMIERLKIFKNNIIINISNKNSNKLIKFCQKNNLRYFVGSDRDVLKRYFDCATYYKVENIIRIPSDCPLIDPKIISNGIRIYRKKKYDYVSNLCPPTFIDGNDFEMFSYKTLKFVNKKAKKKFDREHVTTFIRKKAKEFKTKNFKTTHNLSLKYRITLDYKEDFKLLKKIVSNLGIYANYNQIKKYLLNNKKISSLNKKHIGKMWYQKIF